MALFSSGWFLFKRLMKFRVLIYLIIIVFIVFLIVSLLFYKERDKFNSYEENQKFLSNVEKIQTEHFNNAYFYPNLDNNVVVIDILFKGGSSLDLENYEGISNFLINAMVTGAGGQSSFVFQKLLSDNSIVLDTDVDRDSINIRITSLNSYKDVMFKVLDDILNAPNLGMEEINLTKANVLARLNIRKETSAYLMNQALNNELFPNNKYYRDSLGTTDSINRINRENLKKFKELIITKDNIYISVSGNIQKNELTQKLDGILKKLPSGDEDFFNLPVVEPIIKNKTVEILREDATQSSIYVAFSTPSVNSHEYSYIKLLNIYLGMIPDSVLFQELRNEKGFVYSIYSRLFSNYLSDFGFVKLETSFEQSDNAILEVSTILRNFHETYNFNDIIVAKDWFLNSELVKFSTSTQISRFLNKLQFYGWSFEDYLNERLKLQRVSKKDIEEAFTKLSFEDLLIIKIINKVK